jgi:hypothetical protein
VKDVIPLRSLDGMTFPPLVPPLPVPTATNRSVFTPLVLTLLAHSPPPPLVLVFLPSPLLVLILPDLPIRAPGQPLVPSQRQVSADALFQGPSYSLCPNSANEP